MVLNMFFQVALVPSLEITVFTSEFSLHFQVFTQNVSFEMGHNCEFFPAVATGIPRISERKKKVKSKQRINIQHQFQQPC